MSYFDANATLPLRECARKVWVESSLNYWANPSALYPVAQSARYALDKARESVARSLVCERQRVVFTSGATESNNAVLRHYAAFGSSPGCAVSAIEHESVLGAARAAFGDSLIELPVNESGRLDFSKASSLIRERRPGIVSVMGANSETGVIQPVGEIAKVARECGAVFHCDAVQLTGRVHIEELIGFCDYVTLSSHKLGGPRGVGLLIVPTPVDPNLHLQFGGWQEAHIRAGTENVSGACSFAAAMSEAFHELCHGRMDDQEAFRDDFEKEMMDIGCSVLGINSPRLPNTSLLLMPRHKGLRWVPRMATKGFSLGIGSACMNLKDRPSHVLSAMGVDRAGAEQVVRVSSTSSTSKEEWEALKRAFLLTLKELDEEAGSHADSYGVIMPD